MVAQHSVRLPAAPASISLRVYYRHVNDLTLRLQLSVIRVWKSKKNMEMLGIRDVD